MAIANLDCSSDKNKSECRECDYVIYIVEDRMRHVLGNGRKNRRNAMLVAVGLRCVCSNQMSPFRAVGAW